MTTAQKAQKKFPLVPVIFGVVAVALITVVVMTFDDGGGTGEVGSPVVNGHALDLLPSTGADPALGAAIPEVVGADFDGNPVSIANDGKAKVIVFLAHWCPHCQQEVPIIQGWLDGDPLPADVEFYSVATSINNARDNYPPSSWLDREGWTAPIIVDDASSSISAAYGLTAFPFWVFIAADGTVAARLSGGISPVDLDGAVATLQAHATG